MVASLHVASFVHMYVLLKHRVSRGGVEQKYSIDILQVDCLASEWYMCGGTGLSLFTFFYIISYVECYNWIYHLHLPCAHTV